MIQNGNDELTNLHGACSMYDMNVIDRAVEGGISQTAIAKLLGESVQTIGNWRSRGVPLSRCADFEAACGGSVRRWHLRPDDWHRIWPELIGVEGAPEVAAEARAA
jgi:DNA-binding transcriptional regulator YdaS (Cro superfamily)